MAGDQRETDGPVTREDSDSLTASDPVVRAAIGSSPNTMLPASAERTN